MKRGLKALILCFLHIYLRGGGRRFNMRSRILSIVLALLLVLSNGSFALALESGPQSSGFYDMPNDWSTVALSNAVDNGLLKGYQVDDKTFIYGKNPVTRAEMAAVINRAFGATVKADISGAGDVAANRWYADEMAKAVNMRAFSMDTQMRPNDNITREEAFVVLSRVFKITSVDENLVALNNFSDKEQISGWAKKGLCGMAEAGYIKGSNGMLLPLATISRAEFAVVMDNLVKEYITQPGTVTQVAAGGNVLVRSEGVTLKNLTVKGDLIIGDGVGEGEVILDGVIVEGKVIVRGGGPNSIIIRGNSDIGKIILTKINGEIRVVVEGDADVEIIYVDDGSDDVILQGTVGLMEIAGDNITARVETSMEGRVIITGNSSFVIFGDVTVGDTLIPAGGGGGTGTSGGGGESTIIPPTLSITVSAGAFVPGEPGEFYISTNANSYEGVMTRFEVVHNFNGVEEDDENEVKKIQVIEELKYLDSENEWVALDHIVPPSPFADNLITETTYCRFTFDDSAAGQSYEFTLNIVRDDDGLILASTSATFNVYSQESEFEFDEDGQTITKYIGGKAKVIVPEKIGDIEVISIEGDPLYKNPTTTSVILPDGLLTIGDNAFENWTNLEKINIPDSITKIGKYGFFECLKLESITIPDSITEIGDHAFAYCETLTSFNIPDTVTVIGKGVFASCLKITSINIPSTVTEIGDGAFAGCGFTNITLPAGLTVINDYTFGGCNSLLSVLIPDTVTSIGIGAFSNCTSLTNIVIPNNVTFIGERAFESCTKLASITLSENLASIGYYAFINNALSTVEIPSSVTFIDFAAFRECRDLVSVSILGTGAKVIGDRNFRDCASLSRISVSSASITFGENLFTHATNPDNAFRDAYQEGSGDVGVPGVYTKSGTTWTRE